MHGAALKLPGIAWRMPAGGLPIPRRAHPPTPHPPKQAALRAAAYT